MTARIVRADISAMPDDVSDPLPVIIATLATVQLKQLFNYFRTRFRSYRPSYRLNGRRS